MGSLSPWRTEWIGLYRIQRRYGSWHAEVPPERIRYVRRKTEWPKYLKKWPLFVCPGSWDQISEDRAPFRLEQVRELFVEKIPYRETEEFQRMVEQLGTHGRTTGRHLKSIGAIHDYFAQLEALYESMKSEGYQRRRGAELLREKEITVHISRNGELLKCGEGNHRHAMALLLGLATIPVVVDVVTITGREPS